MTKVKLILIKCMIITLLSCNNSLGSSSDSNIDNSNVGNNEAKYRYLDYLYSEEGANLNTRFLEGDIYSKYPEEVQQMVNMMLRFPVQEFTDAPVRQDWLANSWWQSLPYNLRLYLDRNNYDYSSGELSKGFLSYLDSEEGVRYFNEYLDQIQSDTDNMLNNLNELDASYDSIIMTAVGAQGLAKVTEWGLKTAFSDNNDMLKKLCLDTVATSINPYAAAFKGASLVQSYYSNKQMMKKFAKIQKQLEMISRQLNIIDKKLDKIMGYIIEAQVWERHKDVDDVQLWMESIESQIILLQETGDIETLKTQIKDVLTSMSNSSYQAQFDLAFNSATSTQALVLNNNWVSKHDFPNIKVVTYEDTHYTLAGAVKGSANYAINKPASYIYRNNGALKGINMQDIVLMIKLSKQRLRLAEYIYEGDQLLKYRKKIAEIDMQNIFNSIDSMIDQSFTNIKDHTMKEAGVINHGSVVTSIPHANLPLSSSRNAGSGGSGGANGNGNGGRYPGAGTLHNVFYTPGGAVGTIGGSKPSGHPFRGFTSDFNSIKNSLSQAMYSEYINDQDAINYITHCKALVVSWKITLQAHINAGTNL